MTRQVDLRREIFPGARKPLDVVIYWYAEGGADLIVRPGIELDEVARALRQYADMVEARGSGVTA